MARQVRSDKKRLALNERIKKALAKKPSKSELHRGMTAADVQKTFGNAIVPKPDQIHSRGRKRDRSRLPRLDKRPAHVVRSTMHPWDEPRYVVYPTPNWFTNFSDDIDVSIVVPLYRSNEVIKRQIESWDLVDDGLKKEIIYVDDHCPYGTKAQVLRSWEERKHELKGQAVGKIVHNQKNGGFAFACNTGAKHANGKYVIFLNADCLASKNWIRPLYDLIEADEEIGIVGNMQLKGDRIESAGSEWDWDMGHFPHIGKNTHNGKRIPKAYTLKTAPKDLFEVGEREMVTGACFIIPRKLFMEVEGFDLQYRIGYWEDADLCMRVRSEGYKIYYQPNSVIQHSVGHSHAGGHVFMNENKRIFYRRWVDTGRFDRFIKAKRKGAAPSITIRKAIRGGKTWGCVIACNEEEFLEVSVDSLASVIDEWVFVIGGNEFAYKAGMCDDKGYPLDNTLTIAYDLINKYNGRVIEPPGRLWKDKIEMRQQYAQLLKPHDWMWMLDGDEVYTENQLWRCIELMQKHEVLIMQFHLFWNNMQTIGTDKWDNYPQERIVHWKHGYRYGKSHLNVSDMHGALVHTLQPCWRGHERLFYHYSWVRPIEKIRQKLLYYKHQSGNNNDAYVDDVFLKWRDAPDSVQGKTHPMGGGGTTNFSGIHPADIQKLIDEGKFNF